MPESPRHLNFSLSLREIKIEVPEFPVNNSHNIEKKRKEDKIFEFSDKAATMLRKKRRNFLSITEEAEATILKAVLFHPDHRSPFNFALNSTSKHISIFKTNISGFAKSRFLGN